MLNAMIVEAAKDNVIVAIEPIAKGDTVTYNCAGQEKSLTALEDITIYHKLAACDIAKGQPIVKYGEHIGVATELIPKGAHVHVHNVASMSTATIWKSTGKTWMPKAEKRRISI